MLKFKEDPKLHEEPLGGLKNAFKKRSSNTKNVLRWMEMKRDCKARLADWLKMTMDLEIDQDALIDIQRLDETSASSS